MYDVNKLATIDTFKSNNWDNQYVAVAPEAFIGIEAKLGIPPGLFKLTPKQVVTRFAHSWNHKITSAVATLQPIFLHIALQDFDKNGNLIPKADLAKLSVPPLTLTIQNFTILQESESYNTRIGSGKYYTFFEVKTDIGFIPVVCSLGTAEKLLGIRIVSHLEMVVAGKVISPPGIELLTQQNATSYKLLENQPFTHSHLSTIAHNFANPETGKDLIKTFIRSNKTFTPLKTSGVSKILKPMNAFAEEIASIDPFALIAFRTFASYTHRTLEGVRISALFNDTFKDVKTKFEFLQAIEPFKDYLAITDYPEGAFRELPLYVKRRKLALKSRNAGAYTKFLADIESITGSVDKTKYPRTFKAIESGELPITIFFRQRNSEQFFLLNDIWSLWEKMLTKHREITLAIAKEAASRTYYEKDLMSYFFFITEELPAYLRKHTGKNWTCSPKLVDDPDELNPPAQDTTGTVRKRSALTPIVDNEKRTVVVPYASVCMPGRQTTYCYSHTYSTIKKGLTINGNVALQDIEEKLNGRDDYGLMFYTLTGSVAGRGYPTFLIIFERLGETDTRVHFHRIHPSRSKNGEYSPINNWIKAGYNWIIGNVSKDRIKAQQGDLAFVTISKDDIAWERKVEQYDHHCFDKPVDFAPCTQKGNILGYVKLDEPRTLTHNEHEQRIIPAGVYEIRQCRSWEANPVGVWSLRID